MFRKLFIVICLFLVGYIGVALLAASSQQTVSSYIGFSQKPLVSTQLASLNSEKLFQLVNNWRVQNGFQPYQKNNDLCDLATLRANDIVTDYSHSGFRTRVSNYPSVMSENLMVDAYGEQDALNSWLKSPPHLAAMQKDFKYACVGTKGIYATLEMSNLENGIPNNNQPQTSTQTEKTTQLCIVPPDFSGMGDYAIRPVICN